MTLALAVALAALAAALFLNHRKVNAMVTEIESLQSSLALVKTRNRELMTFVDGFADKLKAIEAAVIARNPGSEADPALRAALEAANAEIAQMKAVMIETSQELAEESRLVASNVAVAVSMVDGMIATGDPYNGITWPPEGAEPPPGAPGPDASGPDSSGPDASGDKAG